MYLNLFGWNDVIFCWGGGERVVVHTSEECNVKNSIKCLCHFPKATEK